MASAAEKIASIRTLQSVIFDMDGVIIDSHPAHRKAWRDFFVSVGRQVSDSELDFVLDGRKRREILRHFFCDVSDAEIADFGRKKDEFFRQISLEVKPNPGVLEFIARLQREGVTLALATSASRARTETTLKRLGLANAFHVVVTGDDVDEGKPNSAIYRLTCQRLRTRSVNSLAIEDAESGVRAAKSAGLKCVGFASSISREKLHSAGADLVIASFDALGLKELRDLVNET